MLNRTIDCAVSVGWVETQQKLLNLLQCWVFNPTYLKGRLKTLFRRPF